VTDGQSRAAPNEARTSYDLEERLLAYAVGILRLTEAFPETRAGVLVGRQLLRSGTAALPHHGEAQAAESRADFIHKLRLGLKELRETHRWLALAHQAKLVQQPAEILTLLGETDQLIRIFSASIRTAVNRGSGRAGPGGTCGARPD